MMDPEAFERVLQLIKECQDCESRVRPDCRNCGKCPTQDELDHIYLEQMSKLMARE